MSLQSVQVLHVHQKVTFMTNRYEVFVDNAGEPGELVGYAEQKKFKIKERITIYTDSSKSQVLFEFNARKALQHKLAPFPEPAGALGNRGASER